MPTDLELVLGRQSAVLSQRGGRILHYQVDGKPVLAGDEPSDAALYRGSLLAPWPNRVAEGRWSWNGLALRLQVNEPSLGTALHGLVAYERFEVVHCDSATAAFAFELAPTSGYPFRLAVESSYALSSEGLVCALRVTNSGSGPAPVALGVHPYVSGRGLVDDVVLTLPAETLSLGDAAWQETDRVDVSGTEYDFREGRLIADRAIDASWTDVLRTPEGRVECTVRYADGEAVVVWGGEACRWLVVYTGHTLPGPTHRRSIAVEPCTAPANALRSGVDLDVLAAGASLQLDWGVRPSWLA